MKDKKGFTIFSAKTLSLKELEEFVKQEQKNKNKDRIYFVFPVALSETTT